MLVRRVRLEVRRSVRRVMAPGAVILSLLAAPPAAWATFTRETVDTGVVGAYASIKVAPDGEIHIAHFAGSVGHLKYSHYDGSAWTSETADGQYLSGHTPSLALDSSGAPHIAYRFYSGRSIRYASRGPSGWTFTEFETDADMEDFISMALDAADRPHVAWWDGTFSGEPNDLKYAHWDGTSWISEVVDAPGNVGRGASLALDSAGHPHISYYDETHQSLKYATFDGTRWNVSTLESVELIAFNFRTAIAVDSHDHVHIVYSAYHQTPQGWTGRLRYAHFDGTAWNLTTIVQAAPTRDYRIPAITIDSDDHPRVTYLLYYNVETYPSQLTYARWDGIAWRFEIIDYGIADSEDSNAIDLDSAERPHVAYASPSYTLIHAVGDAVTGVAGGGNPGWTGGGSGDGSGPSGDPDDIGGSQSGIHIHAVHPNPGSGAEVRFSLEAPAMVDLAVVDAAGRRVASVAHARLAAGEHEYAVPGDLRPGVYFAVLQADGARVTRKIVVP